MHCARGSAVTYFRTMSSNRRNVTGRNSVFYEVLPPTTEEVRTGYLYKSPPLTVISKSMKTWKRRFFVLTKTKGNCHELKYYKDDSKRDRPMGEINLYQVSLLLLHPEAHPTWEWIQKNFRCSSSCVLFMKVVERDYFLIGENSTEMDGWFDSIFTALKTCPKSLIDPEEYRKIRSISEPSDVKTSYNDDDLAENKEPLQNKTPSPFMRRSAPESFNILYSHYDYPASFMKKTLPKSEEEDDDSEVQTEDNGENEEDTDSDTEYMDMASMRRVASEVDSEYGLTLQAQLNEADKDTERAFLNGNTNTDSTVLNRQVPQQSETINPEKKDICVSQEELKNNVIFSEEAGKPCVSDLKHIQTSGPFHKGDQIVAINDLLTDSLDEVHTYLKRLSKDQVKLTILRQPGSRPLSGCSV